MAKTTTTSYVLVIVFTAFGIEYHYFPASIVSSESMAFLTEENGEAYLPFRSVWSGCDCSNCGGASEDGICGCDCECLEDRPSDYEFYLDDLDPRVWHCEVNPLVPPHLNIRVTAAFVFSDMG